MQVEDLHHEELLELDPDGGVIRFAGQRALLLDAVLTQFGFAHGWRMAAAMQKEFRWVNRRSSISCTSVAPIHLCAGPFAA